MAGWQLDKNISLSGVTSGLVAVLSSIVMVTALWVSVSGRLTALETTINLMSGQDRRITVLETRNLATDATLAEIKSTGARFDTKLDAILADKAR